MAKADVGRHGGCNRGLLRAVGGTLQDVTTAQSQSAPRCLPSRWQTQPRGGTAERGPGCAAPHQRRLSQNSLAERTAQCHVTLCTLGFCPRPALRVWFESGGAKTTPRLVADLHGAVPRRCDSTARTDHIVNSFLISIQRTALLFQHSALESF